MLKTTVRRMVHSRSSSNCKWWLSDGLGSGVFLGGCSQYLGGAQPTNASKAETSQNRGMMSGQRGCAAERREGIKAAASSQLGCLGTD